MRVMVPLLECERLLPCNMNSPVDSSVRCNSFCPPCKVFVIDEGRNLIVALFCIYTTPREREIATLHTKLHELTWEGRKSPESNVWSGKHNLNCHIAYCQNAYMHFIVIKIIHKLYFVVMHRAKMACSNAVAMLLRACRTCQLANSEDSQCLTTYTLTLKLFLWPGFQDALGEKRGTQPNVSTLLVWLGYRQGGLRHRSTEKWNL